jgi:multiple sugar transport system substrate-binding protein
MTHSKTTRRVALLATTALVGTAFAAAPAVAQGDSSVCDGQFDGPVTLNFTVWQGSHADVYQETVDAFNAGPGPEMGITVDLNYIPETEYESSIVAAGASGDLPDLLGMDGPFLYNFAWNGFLRPIDSCASQDLIDGLLPSIIKQGTYQDQLYSLGDFDSGLGLWVHQGMLEDVGARIPTGPDDAWTADEFTQILKDLQAAGYGANGPLDIKWAYGAGEWRPYGFAPIVWSAGGDLIDRSTMASVEGFFNGPEAVGAWTTFQGWANDGLIDLVAEDDSNVTVGPDGQPNTGDETPISWVGHWMYPLYSENIDDLLLLPLPDFGNGSKTGMGSWNWAITTGADGVADSGDEVDIDAVWAFVEWLMSDSEIERMAGAEGAVPAATAILAQDPLFVEGGPEHMYVVNLNNAHTDTSLVQSGAVPRPATPAYGVIRDAFSDSMADIIESGADVQSTLDAAAQRIDQEIQDAGYAE